MKNDQLNFSTNWNGKLMCEYFTSIRLHNPRKFAVGNKFDVYLKGAYMGVHEVVGHKRLTVETISEWIALLDTGYPLVECQNIIRTMYKKIDNFTDQSSLSYILLHRIEKL